MYIKSRLFLFLRCLLLLGSILLGNVLEIWGENVLCYKFLWNELLSERWWLLICVLTFQMLFQTQQILHVLGGHGRAWISLEISLISKIMINLQILSLIMPKGALLFQTILQPLVQILLSQGSLLWFSKDFFQSAPSDGNILEALWKH